jgi:hypothetical protein
MKLLRFVVRPACRRTAFYPVFMLIAVWLCLSSPGLMAQESAAVDQLFVDLDGDGINDNSLDLNDDGIPDKYQRQKSTDLQTLNDRFAMFASDLRAGMVLPELSSAPSSQRFGRRFFITRGVQRFRSSFEAGLGFDSGIGLGSASGGSACAGGLCGPGEKR